MSSPQINNENNRGGFNNDPSKEKDLKKQATNSTSNMTEPIIRPRRKRAAKHVSKNKYQNRCAWCNTDTTPEWRRGPEGVSYLFQ
mmetsp:Transcript_17224/g.23937  ORF Transcript_17224/g.23937 Transcript_17224/m.23937 type:complete len:85 (+) Transcript_17224:88-342(+)